MTTLDKLSKEIEKGNLEEIKDFVQKALAEGFDPENILEDGLIKGMERVGQRFASEDMFIPEVILSARTMHEALEVLRPLLEKTEKGLKMKGKIVLGTVAGDIHDIGKSLVKMMFIANGFEVIDIGVDISTEKFIEAIREYHPDVVGMSALLTTTMPAMSEVIEAIDREGLREDGKLKVIVGGAPVTEEFAKQIKADFYGDNALDGVEIIKKALLL